MTRAERISSLLQREFQPSRLEVRDDSGRHAGHAGARPEGQTHYTVIVEAEAFRGKSRVACHRMVNEALAGEFRTGLHALSIQASAPGE